jgi:hypothetical protein
MQSSQELRGLGIAQQWLVFHFDYLCRELVPRRLVVFRQHAIPRANVRFIERCFIAVVPGAEANQIAQQKSACILVIGPSGFAKAG